MRLKIKKNIHHINFCTHFYFTLYKLSVFCSISDDLILYLNPLIFQFFNILTEVNFSRGYNRWFFLYGEKNITNLGYKYENKLAERKGFEPSIPMQLEYTLSKRAPSTTRPPLYNLQVK